MATWDDVFGDDPKPAKPRRLKGFGGTLQRLLGGTEPIAEPGARRPLTRYTGPEVVGNIKGAATTAASILSEPVGMAVDAYDFGKAMGQGQTGRAGLAAAGLMLPFVGGRLLAKAGDAGSDAVSGGARASDDVPTLQRTLYRAAEDDYLSDSASFTDDLDLLRKYMGGERQVGYGGERLYEATVPIEQGRLLDLTDGDEWESLAGRVGEAVEDVRASNLDINEYIARYGQEPLRDAGIEWVKFKHPVFRSDEWMFIRPSDPVRAGVVEDAMREMDDDAIRKMLGAALPEVANTLGGAALGSVAGGLAAPEGRKMEGAIGGGLLGAVGGAAAPRLLQGARRLGTSGHVVNPMARAADDAPAPRGIRAFHGSPHDWAAERLVKMPDGRTEYIVGTPDALPDVPPGATVVRDFPMGRVRMDKIGTGEGAQAYGRGWYGAESPDVAEGYRNTLARAPSEAAPAWRLKGEPVARGTDHYRLAGILEGSGRPKEGEDVATFLQRRTGELENQARFAENAYGPDPAAMYRQQAEALRGVNPSDLTFQKPGRTYEVSINADPDELLDWDAPLSQQPKVRETVAGLLSEYADPSEIAGRSVDDMTGKQALRLIDIANTRRFQADDAITARSADDLTAAALRERGIPGLKYLDQGSRAAGEGTRNYVVFDDSKIDILRKYGMAGLLPSLLRGPRPEPDAEAERGTGQDPQGKLARSSWWW